LTEDYIQNKEIEVLVWYDYEYQDKLGSPSIEASFDDFEEAYNLYTNATEFLCKQIIRYDNSDEESEGEIIDEEWRE